MHSRPLGFSVLEILIVMALMAGTALVVFVVFGQFNKASALDSAVGTTLSLLSEARTLTLASKGRDVFGVHLASTTVTLFEGPSFAPGGLENRVVSLPRLVFISDVSLSGGGFDVVFKKLSGEALQSGTITLSYEGDPSLTRVITVFGTGVSERTAHVPLARLYGY